MRKRLKIIIMKELMAILGIGEHLAVSPD